MCSCHLEKRSILSAHVLDEESESLAAAQLHCLIHKQPGMNHDTLKSELLASVVRLEMSRCPWAPTDVEQ